MSELAGVYRKGRHWRLGSYRNGSPSDGRAMTMEEFDEDEKGPIKSGYPRSFEKWGIDVVRSGYTLLPNHLINLNTYLVPKHQIKPVELMVLIVILSNWWTPGLFPAASKKYISERCGLSVRQVQRAISSLERKRLIARVAAFDAGGANRFDLSGLLNLIRTITDAQWNKEKREPIQLELNFDGRYEAVGQTKPFEAEDEEIPF